MENKKRFENKVCIITGGSSGIGKATAKQMVQEGGKVVILNRNDEEGKAAVVEMTRDGGEAIFIKTDIGDPEDLQNAVKIITGKWEKIDVLVNNAAMMMNKPVKEVTIEEWDKLMAVNLRAVFLLCNYCIPFMDKGVVVNVSSVHAHATTAGAIPRV